MTTPVLTPKSAIGDIIAKLEGASEPARALDTAIWEIVAPDAVRITVSQNAGLWPRGCSDAERRLRRTQCLRANAPRYTASLDASLALVEEKLPGWRVAINSDSHRGPPWAAAVKPHGASWPAPAAMCMSWAPSLAVLIALFRALADGASSRPAGQLREAK